MAYDNIRTLPKHCLKWGAMTKYRKTKPVVCNRPLTKEEQDEEDKVVQELMQHFNHKK